MTTAPPPGLILFAHGSRDPVWAQPFEKIASAVSRLQPEVQVRLAYLEFMQPDLETAVTELLAKGCTEIGLSPLFLGAGGHVRRDLPQEIERLQALHPHLRIHAVSAVGEDPQVIDSLARSSLRAVKA
jgi:sirohydrochlorin cobaltochelatase